MTVENFAHPCDIYTLNKCEDNVRHGEQLSTNEMNANMSHKDFLCSLRRKKWDLDFLYFDHYRMPNAYICNSFSKQFFVNLKLLAKEDILVNNTMTNSGRAEIHLPFCPHLFLHVHYHKLHEEYDILYISEEDLINNPNMNYLYSATKSENHTMLATHFQVVMTMQDYLVQYSKKEMLSYVENMLLSSEDVEE